MPAKDGHVRALLRDGAVVLHEAAVAARRDQEELDPREAADDLAPHDEHGGGAAAADVAAQGGAERPLVHVGGEVRSSRRHPLPEGREGGRPEVGRVLVPQRLPRPLVVGADEEGRDPALVHLDQADPLVPGLGDAGQQQLGPEGQELGEQGVREAGPDRHPGGQDAAQVDAGDAGLEAGHDGGHGVEALAHERGGGAQVVGRRRVDHGHGGVRDRIAAAAARLDGRPRSGGPRPAWGDPRPAPSAAR